MSDEDPRKIGGSLGSCRTMAARNAASVIVTADLVLVFLVVLARSLSSGGRFCSLRLASSMVQHDVGIVFIVGARVTAFRGCPEHKW